MSKSETFALDLPAHLVEKSVRFGASLAGFTFAQLVVLVGRLDRSREGARRLLETASAASDLSPEFIASAEALGAEVDVWFSLVEAEIERRLAGRAASKGG